MKCYECGNPVVHKLATAEDPYLYDLSGLKSVYLIGIALESCDHCGTTSPIIPRVGELHTLIARNLAAKQEPLRGEEIRFLRKWAGFSAVQFAALLHIDPSHLSRAENGRYRLGEPADKLARAISMAARDQEATRSILLGIARMRIAEGKGARAVGTKRPAFSLVRKRWVVAA